LPPLISPAVRNVPVRRIFLHVDRLRTVFDGGPVHLASLRLHVYSRPRRFRAHVDDGAARRNRLHFVDHLWLKKLWKNEEKNRYYLECGLPERRGCKMTRCVAVEIKQIIQNQFVCRQKSGVTRNRKGERWVRGWS